MGEGGCGSARFSDNFLSILTYLIFLPLIVYLLPYMHLRM